MGKLLAATPYYDEEQGISMTQLHALILLWCEDTVPEKAKAFVQMVGASPTDGDVCWNDKDIAELVPAMFILASSFTIQHASTIDDENLAYDASAELPNLAAALEDPDRMYQAARYLTFGYSPDNKNTAFSGAINSIFGTDAALPADIFIRKV